MDSIISDEEWAKREATKLQEQRDREEQARKDRAASSRIIRQTEIRNPGK